jgi:N-alpha-acetyl-L-2,4-diaminobutyrate deacetylase
MSISPPIPPTTWEFDPIAVSAGTVARVLWAFADLPGGSPATIPIIVIAGTQPGKTAVLTAGIHGDEYEGIMALWRLGAQIRPEAVTGRVIIIPIAHIAAYAAATRTSPIDLLNLARVFPGDPGGTITQRLADHLFQRIVRHADLLIDCHSGGVRMAFAPVAGFYQPGNNISPDAGAASLAAAQWLGLQNLWALPPRPGVLSYEAARLGIAVTGAEIGGRGGLLDSDAQLYEQGIRRVLQAHGIVAGDPGQAQNYTHYLDGDWELAPVAGMLVSAVQLGQRVKQNATLATIYEVTGEMIGYMKASHAGFVMGIRHLCAIQVGEWATCVVEEKPF